MWNNIKPLQMLVLISQLGILMLVPIMGCTLFFAWLGERADAPALSVAGFVLGAAGGMRACFRLIRRMTAGWPDESGKAGGTQTKEEMAYESAEHKSTIHKGTKEDE